MNCVIYQITCKATGMLYIGSSEDFPTRKNRHLYQLRENNHHNKPLQSAFNHYGESMFEFAIIESVTNRLNLVEREQFWMNAYDFDRLFNLRPVAHRGNVFYNPQTGDKISQKLSGRVLSEETKMKMSKARRGKIRTGVALQNIQRGNRVYRDHRRGARTRRVAQIDRLTGSVIAVWESIKDAAVAVGGRQSNISTVCCQSVRIVGSRAYTAKTAYGFKWRFADRE